MTLFSVENNSGKVVTLKSLDREFDGAEHEFVVEALDHGQPSRSSQTVVKVLVEDVNDEAPKLVQPKERMFYVNANNAGIGTIIGRIVSQDDDLNDRVTYQLSDNTDLFQLDKWTGDLRLIQALPLENRNTTISVQMMDSNIPPNYRSEKISIVSFSDSDGLNNLIPSNNIDIYVNEGVEAGSIVGSIEADSFARQNSLYKEIKQSRSERNDLKSFYVDTLSGEIYALENLSPLDRSIHEIKVILIFNNLYK